MWNLNSAKAGQKVSLSPPVIDVLGASREIHADSNGAFDITVLPLVRLWKQAGKDNRLPSAGEIAAARNASSWEQIELVEGGALKRTDSACLDLGGIAKGYAVDRAVEILRAKGARGGVVNLGGNLRCFGRREDGQAWDVAVLDPFGAREETTLLSLEVGEAAVCTSAHYHRYVIIEGKRYSHIIDPVTGWPAGSVASATVVAPTCMEADGWATALCVLGVEGLELLPAGVEAMLVVGTPGSHALRMTDGFRKFLPPGGKGS
jgi:thiamine biosynthesis lipoprotein